MSSKRNSFTFLQAAKAVLEELKQPMHFKKITEIALQKGYLVSSGKTPEWTMGARLSVDVKEKGLKSEFVRVGNGKYGLTRWRKASFSGTIPAREENPDIERYWLVALDPENYLYDLKNDSLDTIGVKYRMRKTIAKTKPGDKIVVYIKRKALFSAILSVIDETYIDESDRWPVQGTDLSARIGVETFVLLDYEKCIDARPLYPALEVFKQYPAKHRTLALRNGITELSKEDFEIIHARMKEAL
jgi:predicted RNA-binding protein